jgi:uncharacterized protein (TIGR02300 family)
VHGKARSDSSRRPCAPLDPDTCDRIRRTKLIKPEWGTKRSCPKCGTRFYDLGAEDPVTCIACGTAWAPEPMLKSKQPLPFEVAKPEADVVVEDETIADDDLDVDVDDDDVNPDDENDLGGDDDLGDVAMTKEDGDDV